VTLTLPFPPSTNTAYANVRGRRVKTKKAREYSDLVLGECYRQRAYETAWPDAPRLAVRIHVYPPDRRKRDLANLEKLAVDAVFKHLGLDDSLIDDLHLVRKELDRPNGRLEITITEVDHAA